MKRILIGLSVALLAAVWMSGSWVFFNSIALGAERSDTPGLVEQGCFFHHGGDHGRHHHRFWKMLNLTEDQKKQMFAIRLDGRAKMKTMAQSLKTGREQLIALVKSGKFDEVKAREIAKGQAAVIADLIVEKTRMMSRMYAVLTPEQRAKLQQMHEKWKSHHEKEYEQKN